MLASKFFHKFDSKYLPVAAESDPRLRLNVSTLGGSEVCSGLKRSLPHRYKPKKIIWVLETIVNLRLWYPPKSKSLSKM